LKILVTGAGGFVGRALCNALLQRGHAVVAMSRAITNLPGTRVVSCDLAQPLDIARLPTDCDAMVHLAQSQRFREFPAGARDMFDVNIQSTFELLEFARANGVRRFVYASSGGIYGQGTEAFSDREPLVVNDSLGFYLSTKLLGEILVTNYNTFFSTAILRIFFAYGPGQQPDRLISRLLANVRDNRPIVLEGENGLSINPIYIDDTVEILCRAIESPQVLKLNVAGFEALTLKAIADILGEIVGRKPQFTVRPATRSPSLLGDVSELIEKLGHSPAVSFADGARRVFNEMVRMR
jgi:UDP-glucose 4-epimerase